MENNICECGHIKEQHYNNFICGNSCRVCKCQKFKGKIFKDIPKIKKFLIIKCLNCGLYLVDNDNDSQIDCPYCGYSNELTDIRIEWWDVEEKETK